MIIQIITNYSSIDEAAW